jgi:hypothetical protein
MFVLPHGRLFHTGDRRVEAGEKRNYPGSLAYTRSGMDEKLGMHPGFCIMDSLD